VGDGSYGWKEEAPFDAIITTAAAPKIPQHLVEQLVVGGILVVPVGSRDVQTLYKLTRITEDLSQMKTEDMGGCRFVSLIGESGWKE
jgi:protein-L-isoaspartate(D-aspartate) O-methyltransferase